jgi:hypothetical protein
MNWQQLISVIATMVFEFVPGLAPAAPFMGPAINAVEAEFVTDPTKTKAENSAAKLTNAVTIISDSIAAVNAAKPGTINVPVASAALSEGISAVVNATNILSKTATPSE